MIRPAFAAGIIALALMASSCELFVVGTPAKPRVVIERSQRTAPGVVHLFKAELDSSNTTAATELMVSANGRPLLAVEKYELADDLTRWKSVMNGLPISDTRTDTLAEDMHDVTVTLDYIRKMKFGTIRRDGLWWITKVTDPQRQ
jgi:hypothetical protein